MPNTVRTALIIIWLEIAIGAVMALVDQQVGNMGFGALFASLFLSGLFCIIPYKVSNGSNGARYAWAIINALGVLLLIALPVKEKIEFSVIASYVTIPIVIFSIYCLFKPESSEWFRSTKQ